MKISDNDINRIETVLTNDDLFLRWKETVLGVKVKYVPSRRSYRFLPEAVDKSALILTQNKTNNDKYVRMLNFRKLK